MKSKHEWWRVMKITRHEFLTLTLLQCKSLDHYIRVHAPEKHVVTRKQTDGIYRVWIRKRVWFR